MPGDQIQSRATAPVAIAPTAPVPVERMNPSPPSRPSLSPPPGMQELGRAPQSSGALPPRVVSHHTLAPTLTRPAVDSRPSSPPLSAPLVRNLQVEIDGVVAKLRKHRAFIDRMSPEAKRKSPNPLIERTSLQAMEAAQRGLDAWMQLPSSARAQIGNLKVREFLEEERLNGAVHFLMLRNFYVDSPDVLFERVDRDADKEILVVQRAKIERALVEYRQVLGKTLTARKAVLAGPALAADLSNDVNRSSLRFLALEWSHIMALTIHRLRTQAMELSPSLYDTLNVFMGILKANEDTFSPAQEVLLCEEVDQRALPTALEDMENFCGQIDAWHTSFA